MRRSASAISRLATCAACVVFGGSLASCSSKSSDAQPGTDAAATCVPGGGTAAFATPPDDLSCFGVVELKNGVISPLNGGVVYELNTPLFSDYATKLRTVWLPTGTSAKWADDGKVLEFPIGTVITKSFGFPDDARKPAPKVKWVETRVLVRADTGWVAYPYVWNDAQTKATLQIVGGLFPIDYVHTTGETLHLSYLVPNALQCRKCHETAGGMGLIGPKTRNLNRTHHYDDGDDNQLARWTKLGILTGAPSASAWPKLPAWDDATTGTVPERARAFLDVNCAHCHSEDGGARTTGLVLRYDETDPHKTGSCKNPVAAGKATGGLLFDVVPGKPDESIMIYRLSSTEAGVMMPELGRSVVHKESLDLIRQWVTGLPGTCDSPPPSSDAGPG